MRWLRSTWKLRALTLLLGVSLLPVAFVWPQQDTTRAPARGHADWLRAQVSTDMDEAGQDAFEAALQAAVDEEAHSLQEFLNHFVAAYTQRTGGPSLAQLFGVDEGTRGQMIDELQRRLAQVGGWAAVPRLSMAFQTSASSSFRGLSSAAMPFVSHVLVAVQTAITHCSRSSLGDVLIRALSVSRPRAP